MAMIYHEALMTQAADGVMIYHEKLRFPESGHLFKRVPLVGNHCARPCSRRRELLLRRVMTSWTPS